MKLELFDFETATVDSQGKEINRLRRQTQFFAEDLDNGVILEMVSIPGATFQMGSKETESDRSAHESPQHPVTIAPFFVGKTPVTQAQWLAVAALPQVNRALNPDQSSFKGDNLPVDCVSWYQAVEFCLRLTRKTGLAYRLPSEA